MPEPITKKSMNRILPALLLLFIAFSGYSQYAYDRSVLVDAKIDKAIPSITLSWNKYTPVTNYSIYRKSKVAGNWGTKIATVPATDTSWTDTDVVVGASYEYRVVRSGGSYVGYGYIYSGMDVRIDPSQGKIIVLVDSTLVPSLETEINQYLDDLIGEGWIPIYQVVSPLAKVSDVKDLIVSIYNQDKIRTRSLFLLGHIPVPYSGNLNPDGHPDHLGAWPADVFYADMNGTWTDTDVSSETASDPRNKNIPGDGKYDQTYLASPIELQIGRVDFANMPSFSDNATELIRKYLVKNHAFRTKEFVAQRRGLLQDNFNFSEGFAQSAFKSYSTMFGKDKVYTLPYLSTLQTDSYLWSYGAGGGWYQGAGGIATTTDMANNSLNSVFTMLFGSYFGDWDSQDNFLRAALGSGQILTNVWAGRPNFHFHHMALGETIGYDVRLAQNNGMSLYDPGSGAGAVHVALMGDPTLKLFPIKPVENITVKDTNDHVLISWGDYTDTYDHFEVYSRTSADEPFEMIKSLAAGIYSYVDSCVQQNKFIEYMVRAVAIETTASGTYQNLSKGAHKSIIPSKGTVPAVSVDYIILDANVTFTANGNAKSYSWSFGDGTTSNEQSPIHDYKNAGEYEVILTTTYECASKSDTFLIKIILSSTNDQNTSLSLNLFPTISNTEINLELTKNVPSTWEIINLSGQHIKLGNSSARLFSIPVKELPVGMYFIKLNANEATLVKSFMVQ